MRVCKCPEPILATLVAVPANELAGTEASGRSTTGRGLLLTAQQKTLDLWLLGHTATKEQQVCVSSWHNNVIPPAPRASPSTLFSSLLFISFFSCFFLSLFLCFRWFFPVCARVWTVGVDWGGVERFAHPARREGGHTPDSLQGAWLKGLGGKAGTAAHMGVHNNHGT